LEPRATSERYAAPVCKPGPGAPVFISFTTNIGYIVASATKYSVDMKTQIVNISKLQTSKVMAVLYLVISIPLLLISLAPSLYLHAPIQWGMLWWMPVMYTVFGFVFTFLGAWIYNGIAGWIGGIEFTVSERSVE
jgi:hypothetical protein